MQRVLLCLMVVLSGCGSGDGAASSEPPPPPSHADPPTVVAAAPAVDPSVAADPSAAVATAAGATATRSADDPNLRRILGGHLGIVLPPEARLTYTNLWEADDPTHYGAYDFEYQRCSLRLAVRSDGMIRPSGEIVLAEGERRLVAPDESATHLEVITTPLRTLDTLQDVTPAVGAVVFESDGTATDLWLVPRLPAGQEFAPCREDCMAEARADPRLARCFGVAETLMQESAPTVVVLAPFSARPATLLFGWDLENDVAFEYRGTLPDGWIITERATYDGSLPLLHRRQPWRWNREEPTPRAEVWLWTMDDATERTGARRAQLFGHSLRFNTEGCAATAFEGPVVSYVCLTGSEGERDEMISILATFTRVEHHEESGEACSYRVIDPDGVTNVRRGPRSGSSVVGTLPYDARVTVVQEELEWFRIETPVAGWIFARNLARECD